MVGLDAVQFVLVVAKRVLMCEVSDGVSERGEEWLPNGGRRGGREWVSGCVLHEESKLCFFA